MARKILIILTLLSTLLLSSCIHKELCTCHPHHVRVRVDFDWCDAPDADPAGMCVYFYPAEGGRPLRVDFKGMSGGYVDLLPGKYKVITYNNDTETVLFHSNDSFENHGVYTRTGDLNDVFNGNAMRGLPQTRDTEDEAIIVCPEMMWGFSVYELEVRLDGVTWTYEPLFNSPSKPRGEDSEVGDDFVIMLYPHELVCIYTYEIRDVRNLNHLTNIAVSLTGMSYEMKFSDERLHNSSSSLIFEGRKQGDSTIVGKFYTFGHHLENDDAHRMIIYALMDDGKGYAYGASAESEDYEHYNVTDQVHNAPNPRRVHLVIEGLTLPAPISNGSGFTPTIDEWEVVNKDINI